MDFLDKETMTAELAAASCPRCGHIGGSMTVVLDPYASALRSGRLQELQGVHRLGEVA
jgi:hypothetical protein